MTGHTPRKNRVSRIDTPARYGIIRPPVDLQQALCFVAVRQHIGQEVPDWTRYRPMGT